MSSGGTGLCIGDTCQNVLFEINGYCGAYGVYCPNGAACEPEYSGIGLCSPSDCLSTSSCPEDFQCVENLGCVTPTCMGAIDDIACTLDGGAANTQFYLQILGSLGACCSGACEDLHRDPANCGNCGIACASGQVCANGACVAPSVCTASANQSACAIDGGAASGVCCGGECVDELSDSLNCGGCGWQCTSGNLCAVGACVGQGGGQCPAGTSFSYLESSGVCLAATCGPATSDNYCPLPDAGSGLGKCCAAGCIDVTADPQNCGACRAVCGRGMACVGGECAAFVDCTSPSSNVGDPHCLAPDGVFGSCCNGACVDIGQDTANCGGCDVQCPVGTFCTGYECAFDAGFPSLALALCDGGACPSGTVCTASGCLPTACTPATVQGACALDAGGASSLGYCCGTECISLDDSTGCGACGISCGTGVDCQIYSCTSGCDPATAPCASGSFCGALLEPGFTPVCLRQSCDATTEGQVCAFGYGPLGALAGESIDATLCCGDQCVDIYQDPNNCGECHRACASGICADGICFDPVPATSCVQSCGPRTVCSGGQCVDSLCSGFDDGQGLAITCAAQDGNVGRCCLNDACANLADDPLNCGGCGVTCPTGQSCSGGKCSGSDQCGPGHIGEWCDMDAGALRLCCPGLGCIDTSSDPKNCGTCGSVCRSGFSCVQGVCK